MARNIIKRTFEVLGINNFKTPPSPKTYAADGSPNTSSAGSHDLLPNPTPKNASLHGRRRRTPSSRLLTLPTPLFFLIQNRRTRPTRALTLHRILSRNQVSPPHGHKLTTPTRARLARPRPREERVVIEPFLKAFCVRCMPAIGAVLECAGDALGADGAGHSCHGSCAAGAQVHPGGIWGDCGGLDVPSAVRAEDTGLKALVRAVC